MSRWFPAPVSLSLPNGRELLLHRADEALLEPLFAIEQQAHSHPMSKSTFAANLKRYYCLAVELEGEWIGFGMVSVVVGEAELLDFVVSPKVQGQGIGSRVLARVLDELNGWAERMFLEVRESNTPAIALYQNSGFVEVGIRHGYYPCASGREDAVLMAMEIVV